MMAALVALCCAAFAGVGRNGFVRIDDGVYLTDNPAVADGLTLRGVSWAFTATRASNWHPATWLSHLLDVELFGLRPGPHHLVSLLLHGSSAVLAFLVFLRIGGAAWPALLAAAFFAAHPLRVESVAWAAERKDVLSMLLTLCSILLWLGWVRRRSALSLALSAAVYALALMAKPTPVTLPFALLLLDWWPLSRWGPGAASGARPALAGVLPPAALWKEKIPLFVLAAVSSAVTLRVQSGGGAVTGIEALPLGVRLAHAATAYTSYLVKTLWPADLSVFYPHPAGMPPAARWGAALLALATLAVLALRHRRRPWVAFGLLWFLGTFVPMIGLIQVGAQAMADRYTYLPHLGPLFAIAWSIAGQARRARRPVLVAAPAVAIVALCAATAAAQVGYWHSSLTLFTRATAVLDGAAPASAGALLHNYLGLALEDEGRPAEALVEYRVAAALNPHHAETLNNIARGFERDGRTDDAIAYYRRAAGNAPRSAAIRGNLGAALIRRGDAAGAAEVLREALAIDPEDADARNSLGAALARFGDLPGAEREFRLAVALRPHHADAVENLARLLRLTGRASEADAIARSRL